MAEEPAPLPATPLQGKNPFPLCYSFLDFPCASVLTLIVGDGHMQYIDQLNISEKFKKCVMAH